GSSTPAVIPEEQMNQFKFMLDYSEEAITLCEAPLSPGEMIRVIKGPLTGWEGEFISVNGKTKVVVRMDALGCANVDMPLSFVESIHNNK
ncbi:MAG: transcriptional regulator, partial [Bacteroidaceae bacterium]